MSAGNWRELLGGNHELHCRVYELEAGNAELWQHIAALEKPQRRPIGFGQIEDPSRRR